MIPGKTPHNFLLHLHNCAPWAARLLDGAKAIGLENGALKVKIDQTSWPGLELSDRRAELEEEARRFFEGQINLLLLEAPFDPWALPFPVNASKFWNHAAFIRVEPGAGVEVVALRKTLYAKMTKGEVEPGGVEGIVRFEFEARPPESGEDLLLDSLPRIADRLCALARGESSYAHLLSAFPGHGEAERLEGRLYGIKEWGTPVTPSAILQKYLGRLHYVNPRLPQVGLIFRQGLCRGNSFPSTEMSAGT